MKRLLIRLLLVGSFIGGTVPTITQAEEINEKEHADIQVNGSLGVDRERMEEINESSEDWLNVTVDTATIFYNVNGQKKIQSPTYNITNNSSRPVDVSITNFVQTNNESIADISALTLTSPTATTDETLISNGTLINFGSPIHLFTLANKERKLTTDGLTNYPSATTFGYGGTLTSNSVSKSSPVFTMTLQLDAFSWMEP